MKTPPVPPLTNLRQEIMAHLRTTWKPVTAQGTSEPTESCIGGEPGLLEGESWPACGACQGPMTFFLQVNLGQAPSNLGSGLLQFFHCIAEDCDDRWAGGTNVRLIRIVDPTKVTQLSVTNPSFQFPALRITGWNGLQDLPNWEELSDLGVETSDAERKLLEDVPRTGEKLGGWPYWIQGVDYQKCSKCGQTMNFLFQVDSEVNIPYMWGDIGCGHIFQCPDHPGDLTFAWNCC